MNILTVYICSSFYEYSDNLLALLLSSVMQGGFADLIVKIYVGS